jgi:hypothetical protein
MRKLLKLSTLAALAAVMALSLVTFTGCSDKQQAPTGPSVTVDVAAVKANPDKYLGNVKITGKAGNVFPGDGVVEIADAKACCSLYLFVPFTDAQNEKFNTSSLYKGTFPKVGSDISVTGVLSKNDTGYVMEVVTIQSGGTTLISKI